MLAKRLSELWCELVHDAPMWPIHGHYHCRTCGREHLVPWEQSAETPKQAGVQFLKQALGHR